MSPRTNTASELAWDVILPGKSTSSLSWAPKPRGTLVINEGMEGEERITLPKAVALKLASRQKTGEIDPSSRAELLYHVGTISRACAKSRIERLIDRREYTSSEIERKLCEEGYAKKTIDECVSRACEAGLISNRRFAESYIRTKIASGWGMGRIARELATRGVDVSEVDGWPYDYLDPDDEVTRATDVALRRHVVGPRAYEKLVRYLCGRGFSVGVATRAARQALDQIDGDVVDF